MPSVAIYNLLINIAELELTSVAINGMMEHKTSQCGDKLCARALRCDLYVLRKIRSTTRFLLSTFGTEITVKIGAHLAILSVACTNAKFEPKNTV